MFVKFWYSSIELDVLAVGPSMSVRADLELLAVSRDLLLFVGGYDELGATKEEIHFANLLLVLSGPDCNVLL